MAPQFSADSGFSYLINEYLDSFGKKSSFFQKKKKKKKLKNSDPLKRSIKMISFVQMYSTVGERVPNWRRSKLLKICATSFLA